MRTLICLLCVLTLSSCSTNPEVYIPHIDGYWEIDEVTLNNGSKKDYNFNDTIDYIELSDSLSGFRKKLKPNFMGTYETSKSLETLSLKIENDSLNVYYNTPFSNWKETILKANETQLIIINANKNVYLYKRYQPLDLE